MIHLAKMAFWAGHFYGFLEDKMANLGPVDFLLGLPLNINVNDGHNKFEVHISKNMAKRANFQPKTPRLPQLWFSITQPFFIQFWHPITLKWSARRDESKKLSAISSITFDPFFTPRPHMSSIARMDPKPPSSCGYKSRLSPPTHNSKLCFQKWKAWTPLKNQT